MIFPFFVISVAESGSERGDLENLVKHAVGKYYYIAKFSCQLPPLQATASCLQATCLFIPMCYVWTSYAHNVYIYVHICIYMCTYIYTHIYIQNTSTKAKGSREPLKYWIYKRRREKKSSKNTSFDVFFYCSFHLAKSASIIFNLLKSEDILGVSL